jgi:hypothetical protein
MDETTLRSIIAQLARPTSEGAETIATAINEANSTITVRATKTLVPRASIFTMAIAAAHRSRPLAWTG